METKAKRNKVTYTLKIWFKQKHADFTVAEVYHQPDPQKQVADLVRKGGFWFGNTWIPLHGISTIEQIEEGAEP